MGSINSLNRVHVIGKESNLWDIPFLSKRMCVNDNTSGIVNEFVLFGNSSVFDFRMVIEPSWRDTVNEKLRPLVTSLVSPKDVKICILYVVMCSVMIIPE